MLIKRSLQACYSKLALLGCCHRLETILLVRIAVRLTSFLQKFSSWLFPSWYASTVVENWTLHIQMIGFFADLTFELPLAVQSGDEDILNDGVHFPIEASALQFG